MTTTFFSYERKPVADQIIRLIEAGSSQIVLVGESSKEVVLTLAAELENAEKPEHLHLKSRCLVAETHEAYLDALQNCSNSVLIPLFYPESGTFTSHQGVILIPVFHM